MTQELREKFRLEISERFLLFKETFKQGKEAYLASINNRVDSIHVSQMCTEELLYMYNFFEKLAM
jgi:hypothetical protein